MIETDIDGTWKAMLAKGDSIYTAAGDTFTKVATKAGAQGRALIPCETFLYGTDSLRSEILLDMRQ